MSNEWHFCKPSTSGIATTYVMSEDELYAAFAEVMRDRVHIWLPNILDESAVERTVAVAWDDFLENLKGAA